MRVGWNCLGFIACLVGTASAAGADRLPNIVFILADDLGYGDVGCYNSESKIPTPNLDRLAIQGRRFTDAHSPSAVCSPTRYGILTGQYAWRTRLRSGVLPVWSPPLIDADRLTVAQMLRERGYTTACIGKWHLGFDWPTINGRPASSGPSRLSNVDFRQAVPGGPVDRGFDSFFGMDAPNYPPYCFMSDRQTVGIPSEPNDPVFNRPGPMLPGWRWVDILPELGRQADAFVTRSAQAAPRKPFFLYLPLTSPHYPVVPTDEFRGKSQAGEFGDFVVQTDAVVGQVLGALERAGVADETLVIFTSDNGPEVTGEVKPGCYDRIPKYGHRSMGPLRGAKRDAWEGGHRVPYIARWPGRIPSGSTCDETICHVDFMATAAAIVGSPLPSDAAEDSYDVSPALLGETLEKPIREATILHSASGKFVVRRGNWVLILAETGDDNGGPEKRGEPEWLKEERGYTPNEQKGELYDLSEDLAQKTNQYGERSEIVAELSNLLNQYKASGRSTPKRGG